MYSKGNLLENSASQVNSRAEFTRLTTLIATNVKKITLKVSEITCMTEQITSNHDRKKLQDVQHNANECCKVTAKYIQAASNLPEADNDSEQKQRKTRLDRLTNDFESACNALSKAEKEAIKREKKAIARLKSLSASEQDAESTAAYYHGNAQDQQQVSLDLKALKDREEVLLSLESDVINVHQIMSHVAQMVEDQGEMLDRIEDHVLKTDDFVQSGNAELKKAAVNQKKTRKKKFICWGIIALVVVIIVAAIAIGIASS